MTEPERKFVFRYEITGTTGKAETFSVLHNGIQVTSRMIGIEVKADSGVVTFAFGDGRKSDEIVIDSILRLEVPLAARAVEVKPKDEGSIIDFTIALFD